MKKYVFPAIFTEEVNGYSVNFPDVKNCFTDADTLSEALERASDVLGMMLTLNTKNGIPFPKPTPIKEITTDSNSFATMVVGTVEE